MAISNEMLFGHLFLLGMDIRTASKPKQRGFHGQGCCPNMRTSRSVN